MKKEYNENIRVIDKIVCDNIKKLRIRSGLPQRDVATVLGVSTQQLQKYEKGINRVSCGKLSTLSTFFNIPLSYFFNQSAFPEITDSTKDKNKEKQIIALLQAFNAIEKDNLKTKIIDFVNTMAKC
jgi:transcriptional regulator with XRE-family HTH domain